MYSDYLNSRDKNESSLSEQLKNIDDGFLRLTVEKLKKEDSFYIFGGGVRAVKIAQYFFRRYNLLPAGFLVNKKYKPEVGKKIYLDAGKYAFIYEYESIVDTQKTVLLLGVPEQQIPEDVLNNPNNEIISISFPNCIDGNNYISRSYYELHAKEYDIVYNLLEDEYSRQSYYQCMKCRLSGEKMDFIPVPWSWEEYFLPDIITWKKKEVLVDCGAFTGDTIEEFLKKMPDTEGFEYKIYSFEPSIENYKVLVDKYKQYSSIKPINKGIFSKDTLLYFNEAPSMNPDGGILLEEGDYAVPVDRIDNVLGDEIATIIKMDVQGSELEGLKGAYNQITRNRPRLAICLYHKIEDMFELPLYIHSIYPDYRFYVRPHAYLPTELTLFCI